jgi:hypothetical protein
MAAFLEKFGQLPANHRFARSDRTDQHPDAFTPFDASRQRNASFFASGGGNILFDKRNGGERAFF